jgi:hypothetical protein
LELAKRSTPPIDRAENDGDHPSSTGIVPSQGALHLDVVAVVGCQELRADQQQDDAGRVEMLIDLATPFGARRDLPIVPGADDPLAPQ